MEINSTRTYSGPSVYCNQPVVHVVLGAMGNSARQPVPQSELDRVFAIFPEAQSRLTSCEATALEGGVFIEHLFEHLCIELQQMAGEACTCACVRSQPGTRVATGCAALTYEEPDVGIDAAGLAAELITAVAGKASSGDHAPDDFPDKVDAFRLRAQKNMLPVQDRVLRRAALKRGIPVMRLSGRTLVLGQGCMQKRLSATKTSQTNTVSNDIAANKDYSRRLLGDVGLPIPRYRRVYRSRAAREAAKEIGYPVVVKPNNGKMGLGVSVGMKNSRDVRAAYKKAREYGRSVLVEEIIEGNDYRMLVVDGKLCAAAHRVPAHVVGDGVQSVQQLIDEVNRDPRRGIGPRFSWTRIKADDQSQRLLEGMGYTLASIPRKDEVVYLRRNANTSDGGTAVDVTDDVHPDNRAIAERAARVIGLDIAGVDILTSDISKSILRNGGAICEINSRPGIRKHLWPAEGQPRDVAGSIIDMLYPESATSRIEIVAITGIGDRKSVARRLARQLAAQGRQVGLATHDGVVIADQLAHLGRLAPPEAARMILLDPQVDIAVIEVPPADVIEHGLGYDVSDVCVIVGDVSGDSERATVAAESEFTDAIKAVADAAGRVIELDSDKAPVLALSDAQSNSVDRQAAYDLIEKIAVPR